MKSTSKNRLKIILTGALITGIGIGAFSNCMGVFIGPVCADLGFTRGEFTLIGTLSVVSSILVLLWFGRLLQSVSIKKILLVCAWVCAFVPFAYSFCHKLWHFYILAAINGLAINGLTMLTVGVLLEQKLNGNRGAAIGASFAGVGVFSSVMLPALQHVVAQYGWRWAFRVQSIFGFSVLTLTIIFLVEDISPKRNEASTKPSKGLSYAEALKTKAFKRLFIGVFCANFVNLALFNHAIPFMTDIGYAPMGAAMVSSAATLLMTATKPLYGFALDRIGLKAGALVLGAVLFLGSLTALSLPRFVSISPLYAVLLAGCACANALPANIYAAKLFGKRDYARIVARLTVAASAGAAIGTPLAGFIFDRLGSYRVAWLLCVGLSVISAWQLLISITKNTQSKNIPFNS